MEKAPGSLVLRATPFIGLLLLCLLYTVDFEFNVTPSDQWNKLRTNWSGNSVEGGTQIKDEDPLYLLLKRLVEGESQTQLEATGFACDSKIHTEVCVSSRPVRIDTLTMKVYAPFSQGMPQANRTIHPYARKDDKSLMNTSVTPVQILPAGNITLSPPCQYTHNVTAVIFSSGGFAGNIFHEFNEVIIPLFLTTRHFQSRLQFILTDFRPDFVAKYKRILSHLSSYEVINPASNGSMHCFPGAVVGLHFHDLLAISTTNVPEGYSMLDFKQFLRESYNIKIQDLSQTEKPVLVLVSRQGSRMFLNEDQMVTMMRELGFSVVVAKPDMMGNLDEVAEMLNPCSVLVGAHGAGLTNQVFLPEGAVLVQVVGLGLEWVSDNYFGGPGIGMGLNYVEYKIEPEESSLISIYGRDHPVIFDPSSMYSQGYEVGRALYLIEQKFNIDLVRFRKTLVKALGLLGRSAPSV
ncbi:alpha-1,3-arabinosyltransferase XAT3-like isoform X1 [Rhododendron vialii]|uniref:alpha-1,3-arabinosyltransferase XAT3-like isoform X1 n=1 Tax=Rhododendron vialii TaxID=182163 RepID=UPI00265D87CD|nr:alpha-1,3-arabinosyltransferase XAT3-like isoform X1 [Rhododendron vialii]